MHPETPALFRELADRSPAEREAYYAQHHVDAAVRAEIESLLRFDGHTAGSLHNYVADAAEQMLLDQPQSAAGFAGEPARAATPPMSMSTPLTRRRLGVFEIQGLLGAGGMGEVYRARDTRLGRDVAIKILPRAFRDDRDHVARFEREARVLASLNHPHIGVVHGLEEVDGLKALVMELVEGEDLAERLSRGPVPIADALDIARQITDALEAAHAQGIVHRDLKPANIRRRRDGTVKVLDFGLAKPLASIGDAAISTQRGTIRGTPAYMSPEQARGEPVNSQADIWSFGVVLFELLSGVSPFGRQTTAETLASVLAAAADYSLLPPATPPNVRHLIRRCIERDRRRRLQHIGDARLELEDARAALARGAVDDPPQAGTTRFRVRAMPIAALLGATAIVVLGLVTYRSDGSAPGPGAARFAVFPPDGNTFQTPVLIGYAAPVGGTISPDGRTLAFTASDSTGRILLWIRSLRDVAARALPGSDGAALPFWSPDSRSLGFFANGKLKRIDVDDGTLLDLCSVGRAWGGAWNRDGVIVFAPGLGSGLSRIDAAGGAPQPVTTIGKGQQSHRFPSFLPDGRRFLYYIEGARADDSGVFAGDLDGGSPLRILSADTAAIYASSGHLLFVRQATLFAQALDATTLQVAGDPVPLAESVPIEGRSPAFSVSNTDVLTYRTEAVEQQQQFAWLDRTGRLLETVGPPGSYRGVDLSPDGRRVAVHRHDGNGGDIWIFEPRGATTRVTFDAAQDNSSPIWSPDGKRIAFASFRNQRWGLYQKPADATDTDEPLIESEAATSPASWSPDGRYLVYWSFGPNGATDQWLLHLASGGRSGSAAPFMASRFAETHSQVSPNGKWVAYAASTTGRLEVYVRPFPSGEGVFPVSTNGGVTPRWSQDGRELFYATTYDRSKLMAVPVHTNGTQFVSSIPQELFDTGMVLFPHSTTMPAYHSYAVSPDGQRFLIPRPISRLRSDAVDTPITVVLNWTEELKPRVPTR